MTHRRRGDVGGVVVESSLVLIALVMLFLAVVQVGLYVHVRNVVVASAAEGARAGAVGGGDPAAARSQTRQVLDASVGGASPDLQVQAAGCTGGADRLTVTVTGRVPSVVALAGPLLPLTARAHALCEGT